jgi:hypothetical protein
MIIHPVISFKFSKVLAVFQIKNFSLTSEVVYFLTVLEQGKINQTLNKMSIYDHLFPCLFH